MKWKLQPKKNEEVWHRVFAILPVRTIHNELVWLQYVSKRVIVGQFDIYVEYKDSLVTVNKYGCCKKCALKKKEYAPYPLNPFCRNPNCDCH